DMPFVGLMTIGMCFFMMAVFGRDRDKPADKLTYGLSLGWMSLLCVPQISLVLVGLSRWRGGSVTWMETFTGEAWRVLAFGGALLVASMALLLVGIWKGRRGDEQGRATQKWFALGGLGTLWAPLLVVLVIILIGGAPSLDNLAGWFKWGPTQAALYTSCFGAAIFACFYWPNVERRRVYLITFYVFIGLASLAKGLLGFMLPGAVLFFYILITREWGMLKKVDLHIGIPVFVAVAFPWYAAMLVRHTEGFWNRFFVHDHFKRFSSGVHQLDTGSFEHFIRWLGYGMFPWTAFIPAALGSFFSGRGLKMEDDRARASLMLLLWVVVAFTLFSLSSTKFHHYVFPVVPPMAMLIAIALDDALDAELPNAWPLYLVGVGVLGVVAWDMIQDPKALKDLFTYKYDRKWDEAWNSGFRWALFGLSALSALGALLWLVRHRRIRRIGLGIMTAGGVGLLIFSLDVYMPAVSSTWSQKGVWDAYYEQCTNTDGPPGAHWTKRFCEEPIIAYKLNWRGETFYSRNEVIPIRDDDDFDHFIDEIGEDPFYGIMEMSRYRGQFRRELPEHFKDRTCVTYDENLKFKLIKIPCDEDDPDRVE
ncbi:MAG: ArnT family glycosyltransferase, partial [Persicimonas sp.]